MNSRLIIMLFSVLMIVGCSYDQVNDPLIEEAPALLEKGAESKNLIMMPIQFEEYGKFHIEDSKLCSSLELYYLKGQFSCDLFGEVYTESLMCSDGVSDNQISGKFSLSTGDEIHFQSATTAEDSGGPYYVYQIKGGTGPYMEASGKLKVYFNRFSMNGIKGTYHHSAEGVISYFIR